MLFHSFIFVLGFLPISVIGFWTINRFFGWSVALVWLIIASLLFYAQWGFILVALLVCSITINYIVAKIILSVRAQTVLARVVLQAGIIANLAYLGYFKYANFFIDNLNLALNTAFHPVEILLPVGISFYTFIQIGYLIDVYNGQVQNHRLDRYALFSSFFPYITAGPLVLQKEMLTQFFKPPQSGQTYNYIAMGLAVFSAGLFKKVVFADSIGVFVDTMFDNVSIGAVPTTSAAWLGSLGYTLQLYFDFSGYSDMALGIGLLFGFQLPLNFRSPLKSCNIIDFWHRWHITMTRFFTTYVYSPIAIVLMRRSLHHGDSALTRFLFAVAFPVVATFVLAGLWHGAGWTFVVFGLIHGVALAINHGWRALQLSPLPYPLGWLLTMAVVVVGLVFFRSGNVTDALTVLSAMIAMSVPDSALILDNTTALVWVSVLGFIVLVFPNTMEIIRQRNVNFDGITTGTPQMPLLVWRPSLTWAIGNALILMLALGFFSRKTVFLYYQF